MNIDIPEHHQRQLVHVLAALRQGIPSAIAGCTSVLSGSLTPLTMPLLQDAASAALTDLMYATHAGEAARVQAAWRAQACIDPGGVDGESLAV